jgi:hypothetical protein
MKNTIVEVIAALAILVGLSFLFSWPVMALWNECLVDAVSGVNEITWLQAWGLSVLCNLLFNKTISK